MRSADVAVPTRENKRGRDTGGLQRWGGASAGDHGGLLPVYHGGIGSPYPVWHWGLACQRCPSAGCASPSWVALGCPVRGYPCGTRRRGRRLPYVAARLPVVSAVAPDLRPILLLGPSACVFLSPGSVGAPGNLRRAQDRRLCARHKLRGQWPTNCLQFPGIWGRAEAGGSRWRRTLMWGRSLLCPGGAGGGIAV